ncbi:MAG: tetratricopeptide repeat protein, partial [Nitrososphaerales archaeon]
GTEEHLWSSNYDSRLDDIFAIQTDVASKVAASLSAGLFFSSRAVRKDTDDVEAYTLYLRAMQLSYDFTEAALRETVALLQRAVAKDPEFARAYAALADAWHGLGVSGYEDFTSMTRKAEADATKALALDPRLAETHAAMAGVHSMMDRFDQALAETEAAIGINPNLSEAYMSLGILDCIVRTARDGLESFKRAYELDPLSPGSGEVLASLATWVGEDQLALDVLARMREFHAKDPRVYLHIADHYMEKGDFVEAQKALDTARSLSPDEPTVAPSQALLFARAGRRREAEDLLEREVLAKENQSLRLNGTLWVRAALGDLDEAFEVLMKEAETHSWPAFVRVDPLYAGMRKDPRYLEFCRRVGIPP